jgi:hypothetical protein
MYRHSKRENASREQVNGSHKVVKPPPDSAWNLHDTSSRKWRNDTREQVIAAEQHAIATEKPRFNRCYITKPHIKHVNPDLRNGRLQLPVSESFMREIDEWRRQQSDLPSRNEAIFRLVRMSLAAEKKGKRS